MARAPFSTKERLIQIAEMLYAEHGLDGVSLRQISARAGASNNSAVQYHFGSRDGLVDAIFEYRLPEMHERRRLLVAQHRPADLRSWVECFVLPTLEQGERSDSHYLGFVAKMQHQAQEGLMQRLPDRYRVATQEYLEQMAAQMAGVPEPLRSHRIGQALAFSVHSSAEREWARAAGHRVLPFGIHVTDLLDGLVGFLIAPVSAAAWRAVSEGEIVGRGWSFVA
ncbi:MAG: TetR/AcrR family transcriptional regulator [Actinomycetota bacterium]|nr:TetR/AcrR family transcriptional regulator [Actinomycetota bacterium]